MKLSINFDTKVITLEQGANLGEFVEKIEKMIPDWKAWKLDTNTTITWSNPITVPYRNPWGTWPWYAGTTYCDSGTTTALNLLTNNSSNTLTSITGTYQVEV